MPATTLKPLTISEYEALVNGIPKYCPNAVFIIASQTYTAPEAVTFIKSVLDSVSAVATAKSGWVDARLAEARIVAGDGAAVRAIRENVALMFRNNTTTLAAFEIAPQKPRLPLSVQARAAATAKARATRIARGTESKKKKAEITGNVTGVTITPVTTPAASASSTAPATTSTTSSSSSGATVSPVTTGVATPAASSPASPTTGGGATPVAPSAPQP